MAGHDLSTCVCAIRGGRGEDRLKPQGQGGEERAKDDDKQLEARSLLLSLSSPGRNRSAHAKQKARTILTDICAWRPCIVPVCDCISWLVRVTSACLLLPMPRERSLLRRAERNHLGTYEQAAEVTRRNCSCSVFLSNFGGIVVDEKEGHAVVHQSAVYYVMHMGSQWVG